MKGCHTHQYSKEMKELTMKELDNLIICGDCLDIMPTIKSKSVDMILCDLPYEVLHKNNPNAQWDRLIPMEPLWEQYKRVIKDNGAILLFCQGMFTAQLMMSQPKLWRYNLVWDKCRTTGFLNANRMPLRRHEDIAVFYKSLPVYHPQMKRDETNHPRGIHNSTNNCYGKYKTGKVNDYNDKSIRKVEPTRPGEKFPTSIISIEKLNATKVCHPTQKPVELLRYLIRTYTNPGDVVLDNCAGSMSTGVACIREKRKYILIEKDENYFNLGKKRLENEKQQPTLF